jgi:hypothetical protein
VNAPFAIEVEGAKELRKIFRDIGDKNLGKELRAANKTVSQIVVEAALPNVPVRSGKLRRSVKALATQTAAYGKAGSKAVPYAAAIHWGEGVGNVHASSGATFKRPGRNIRGVPFLWDAADQTINRAVREYEDAVQKILDGVRSR